MPNVSCKDESSTLVLIFEHPIELYLPDRSQSYKYRRRQTKTQGKVTIRIQVDENKDCI